jgi:hypothetical protein
MRNLFRRSGRGCPQDGKFLLAFVLSLLPMTAAIGCVADYARVLHITARLQAAADSASLEAIAATSPGFTAAGWMLEDGTIAVGMADARCRFHGHLTGVGGYQLDSLTPLVAKAGSTLTSTVAFTAHVQSRFLGLLGLHKVTVKGAAIASASLPKIAASGVWI